THATPSVQSGLARSTRRLTRSREHRSHSPREVSSPVDSSSIGSRLCIQTAADTIRRMARQPCLAGTNVVLVRVLLHERLGADGVEQVKAALPPDVRDRYFGATSLDWVPVADVNLMNEKAAALM